MCSYDKWRERKLRENTYRVTLHLQCRVFLFQSQQITKWKEMYFRRSRNRHKSHSSGDNLRLGSVFFTANRSESCGPNLHNFFAIWSCMTVSQQRYNNRDRRQWIENSPFLADSVCSLGLLNLKNDQISHFKTSAWKALWKSAELVPANSTKKHAFASEAKDHRGGYCEQIQTLFSGTDFHGKIPPPPPSSPSLSPFMKVLNFWHRRARGFNQITQFTRSNRGCQERYSYGVETLLAKGR